MRDKKERNDVARMGSTWARIYYHIAKEILDTLGKDGEAALKRGLQKAGIADGELLRQMTLKSGEALDLTAFKKSMGNIWPEGPTDGKAKYRTDIKTLYEIDWCCFADSWSELPDGGRIGALFCDAYHPGMWSGFHEKLRLKLEKVLTKGDPHCSFDQFFLD